MCVFVTGAEASLLTRDARPHRFLGARNLVHSFERVLETMIFGIADTFTRLLISAIFDSSALAIPLRPSIACETSGRRMAAFPIFK